MTFKNLIDKHGNEPNTYEIKVEGIDGNSYWTSIFEIEEHKEPSGIMYHTIQKHHSLEDCWSFSHDQPVYWDEKINAYIIKAGPLFHFRLSKHKERILKLKEILR